MEIKHCYSDMRRVPIGSRLLNSSKTIGQPLRYCLAALLLLFAAQGAWADTGYTGTTDQVLKDHPDEPAIQVVKSTYNMTGDLNVYEFKLRYYSYGSPWGRDYSMTKWGYKGDVWLTIDGNNIVNLASLVAGGTHIGDNSTIEDTGFSSLFTGWDGYTNREIASAKGSGISKVSDVYVSISKPEEMDVNSDYAYCYQGKWKYTASGWNTGYSTISKTKVVTVRVGMERTWNKRDFTIGVKGNWYGGGAYDSRGAHTKTAVHEYTTSFECKAPTIPWPSSSGTLTRSGNGKVTYKAPTGLSTKSVKQIHSNGDYVNDTENCTFLNNVYLMKAAGNTSAPWTSIDKASDYYAKVENVTSNQTQEFSVNNNYDPVTVYPCWEFQSENDYFIMPTSSTKYKQSHDMFMDAITVPGYPKPNNVQVETKNVFNKLVRIWWEGQVASSESNTKGKWRVFRKKAGETKLTYVGDTSNYSNTEVTDETGNINYDETVRYVVIFVPNGWTVNQESDAVGLSAESEDYILKRSFDVNITSLTNEDSKITVSWSHSSISDATSTNKYIMEVQRSLDGNNWAVKKTIEVTDSSVTSGSWADTDIAANTTYYYRIRFQSVQGQQWFSKMSFQSSSGSSIVAGSFTASRGNYNSTVKLTWQVRQVGTEECYFTLQRRPLGTAGDEGWVDIYTTHGTARSYSYDDQTVQTGSFNEYKLILSEKKNGTVQQTQSTYTDGFCMSFGTMSGRVSFGSGTAVKDVKVTLRPQNADGKRVNRFRSLQFLNSGAGINCEVDSVYLRKLMLGDFSWQMWLNPDNSRMYTSGGEYLALDVKNAFSVFLKYDKTNKQYQVGAYVNGAVRYGKAYIPANKWSHVTVTHKGNKTTVYVSDSLNAIQSYVVSTNQAISWKGSAGVNNIALANSGTFNHNKHYEGLIDEFRLFNRELSKEDIERNFSHPLVGSEEGLQIYYSFDEGLENQKLAYDFSKQNGISNGHHGTAKVAAQSSQMIPNEDQFSLMGYTDGDGNYMVGGIPFSGDGTNYVATPTLGIHQFSPANQSRFFSTNSMVQTGVDYEDVSAFPVSGRVYFENTNIPVEEAYLYVDGNLASKDGEAVKTNTNGEFSIDVPIGKHFIQVKKSGHTFVNNGYYPEQKSDSIIDRETFNGAKSNLEFKDNTLVIVAGRVSGGNIENEKPLGLDQSTANIGQATLTLHYTNNDKYKINTTSSKISYESATGDKSAVSSPASSYEVNVKTDPKTGEWSAKLPPLYYTVQSVSIPSNTDILFKNLPDIDATNPLQTKTDTLKDTDLKFEYCAAAKIMYKAPNTFTVKEREDGSFGDKNVVVTDINGNKDNVALYTVDENGKAILDNNGKVQYTYGYPVYQEMKSYTYYLHGCEQYVNKDGAEPAYSEVPLAGDTVLITNEYSTMATVYTNGEDQGKVFETKVAKLALDDNGDATYEFRAGLPNIQSPYTRGISITYTTGGSTMNWSENGKFKAIVLGSLPLGNDFVTEGPDELEMVLRDPPGSASKAWWKKGTTHTSSRTLDVTLTENDSETFVVLAGQDVVVSSGIGLAKIDEAKAENTGSLGLEFRREFKTANSWTTETTLTEEISTSDAPEFVGDVGDIFVGQSKNLVFGSAIKLGVTKNEQTNNYELGAKTVNTTGDKFKTHFIYTTYHIENVLIPRLKELRDSTLQVVADPSKVAQPTNGEPIYITTLTKDDPRFGTNNHDEVWGSSAKIFTYKQGDKRFVGPSYTIVYPTKLTFAQDMIMYYNSQIALWEKRLADNEEAKVKAISNSADYLADNHSISAGTSYTNVNENHDKSEHTATESFEAAIVGTLQSGTSINGCGIRFEVVGRIGTEISTDQTENEDEFTETSYTLAEVGDDDYLTIDVYNAPDGFGPIFYTKAGATSCPYEDEVVTKYYQPGTVIGEKTIQIEKPEIEARTAYITGIPAGGKGTFQVYLRNNSDTKEDVWYNLNVVDGSNPNGLVVLMDGVNINKGRSILVKAGETMTKTFTVEQSNTDVLTYENIQLRLSSQCQPDNTSTFPEIADTTTISVFFQPSCSDVQLATSHRLVNTTTQTVQTLSISGYNYSMASLMGIRLQYKGENDADFRTLHEFIRDYTGNEQNKSVLPALEGANKLNFTIDLRENNYTDQTYVFRAITVCNQGGQEVNNESEEIEIVRDMALPMLIATPTPASGILTTGSDMTITFNEDIKNGSLSKANNFVVEGELNETKVSHEVALSLTGNETAKTQGTMDLAGKSFSASMWLNYSSNGTLLQHGTSTNNFTVAVEGGKLAISVNDNKITSADELPKDEWIYLNVSYDAENGQVSAGYAQDSWEKTLISNAAIGNYDGNGPVCVGGNNLTAKVQELAIWNSSRSMAEAQGSMYTTKSQFTNGLIGYWQMNEGHGDVATDKARSRNLSLPSQNAWWIDGENFALTFDGGSTAKVNISKINTTDADDYLVEAWFKADDNQNEAASILSTLAMDLRLNAQGKLEIGVTKNTLDGIESYNEVMNANLRDGQWHHLAVNVLKSTNGSGIVYVDGVQRKQLSASNMPVLYGNDLVLGGHRIPASTGYDQLLKGAIDEVRIWKGRLTADVIKGNMYNRMKGNEAGLVAYYPIESSAKDNYNQLVYSYSYNDKAKNSDSELSFVNLFGETISGYSTNINTAALKLVPNTEEVGYSFVASERQITVSLTEEPYKIEGCHIFITAKDVKDVHGNPANPITWSVYVQQNNMKWLENNLTVTKNGAEEQTFTATIENRNSENESWSLSGMPEWLSADIDGGILMPQATQRITFTVAAGLPIGSYEAIVNLTGSQSINTPLYVTVSSEGNAPDWSATPGENTMTVVGVLKINDVQSCDPKDMVAAFRGTECVGVAHPKYFARYDSYMVLMNIYGKNTTALTYKAYDASTGIVYPSVSVSNDNAMTFVSDKTVGTFVNPVTFAPLNEIEQDLSMNHGGWKWFSLNAKPKNASAEVVFADAKSAITTITDGTNSVIDWAGELKLNNYASMYKLNAKDAYTETFVGEPTNPADVTITLNKGWSWIGYPCQAANSLDAAFASAEPEEGDMVKGQSSFAVYTEGEWIGTLTSMQTGEGYAYNSNATTKKTFNFPKPTVSGRNNVKKSLTVEPLMPITTESNMTIIAVVKDGDEIVENANVSIFAGAELRGRSVKAVKDGAHFITIGGQKDDNDMLTFVVETEDGEHLLNQSDVFVADAHKGSIDNPYVLQLNEATGIDVTSAGVEVKSVVLYDGSGRVIVSDAKKVFTKEDLKQRVSRIYYQKVNFADGRTYVQKLMK